eukprot:CAMPEP_0179292396 /NCGR_PEP_ID=MMETSP0797-20121207/42834_1 /TAXON_ID=47934 /ORGANISM="Dinophysis acuminata, Strain DAEP01" /LENGTH=49 /DNA_ID= /DNA_START= /DNA_END= /DNA_ORIENTATION=
MSQASSGSDTVAGCPSGIPADTNESGTDMAARLAPGSAVERRGQLASLE